ncbi:hypothetical protein FRC12_015118 [Ceratobasidium sp. 428]|nr:hypothetical protein FRC12_015118 [Ceratobasidium sp. 428]
MSRIPKEILGKKLDDYLLHDYNPNELPPDSLLQRLDSGSTIKRILAKDNVTAATLYELTRLVLVPNRLLSFEGTRIMPALMDLLRSYSRHHQPYDYEYGFHCVEAILFTLLIGVLAAKAQVLQVYVDETMTISSQASTFSLHDAIDQCLGPALEMCQEVNELNETFWGFDSSTHSLVPTLGGFTVDDLHYFVNAIWGSRKQMFWAHTITGASALWRCGIYVLCLFHRRTMRSHELMPKLYNIALRLEFNSPEDNFHLLDFVLKVNSNIPLSLSGKSPLDNIMDSVVDEEDARLLLRKYHPWVILLEERHWNTLNLCAFSASNVVLLLNDLELHLEFLKSHLRVIWSGVLRHDERPGEKKKTTPLILFTITTLKHIEFMVTKNLLENVPPCIDMLFTEGDFVNLMGRSLLWFSRFVDIYSSKKDIGGLMSQLDMLQETLIELTRATGPLVSNLLIVTPRPFDIWADWNKTWVFFQYSRQMHLSRNNRTLSTYLDTMTKAWKEFGKMMPNVLDLYCANPDCGRIDPTVQCAQCHTVRYCNKRCQYHHWYYPAFERSHSLACAKPKQETLLD